MDITMYLWNKVQALYHRFFEGGNAVGEEVWGAYLINAVSSAIGAGGFDQITYASMIGLDGVERAGTDIMALLANADKVKFVADENGSVMDCMIGGKQWRNGELRQASLSLVMVLGGDYGAGKVDCNLAVDASGRMTMSVLVTKVDG